MAYRYLSVLAAALLVSICLWVPGASAQWMLTGGYVVPTNSSTFTIDVLPQATEVRLNGVRLGTGLDLVAKSVFVTPGEHELEFSAPGYLPTRMRVTGIPDWTSRVQIVLVPDRRP
ncbi:MAG TPA: hypothetical protein VMT79_02935 [Candidatus Binatia bacterium]|jgi:hypothetical protein|nr:hypothetical protein [Candidatus Binatia bacterium]